MGKILAFEHTLSIAHIVTASCFALPPSQHNHNMQCLLTLWQRNILAPAASALSCSGIVAMTLHTDTAYNPCPVLQVSPVIPCTSAGKLVASRTNGAKRESKQIHTAFAAQEQHASRQNSKARSSTPDLISSAQCLCRYELGRQPGNTKLSSNVTVRRVRVRGGNFKFRALRLDTGNFSWGSEVRYPATLSTRPLPFSCCNLPIADSTQIYRQAVLSLQATTRKTRILDVVYNASNNELVSEPYQQSLAACCTSCIGHSLLLLQ